MARPSLPTEPDRVLAALERAWGPASRTVGAEDPRTLAGTVFQRLRADIIAGDLSPGARLRFNDLKQVYEAGFSPLREALYQLAADGLVVTEGQKGFRVAPVSLDELREIAALRSEMEGMALHAAIARGGAAWKAGIALARGRLAAAASRLRHPRQRKRRRTEAMLDEAIREVHLALTGACGSPWLLHFCERLQEQAERYRRCFSGDRPHAGFHPAHYETLIDAALAGDSARAVDILGAVIARQAAYTAAAMRRRGHGPAPPAPAALPN